MQAPRTSPGSRASREIHQTGDHSDPIVSCVVEILCSRTISNLRPCYTMSMLKRTLNKTNPYLADPARRRAMFQMTVYTSTAIEGVKLTTPDLRVGIKPSRRITPYVSAKSSRSRR